MSEGIFPTFLTIASILFVIWNIIHSQKQKQKAKQQIVKRVQKIGGRHIVVEPHSISGATRVVTFKVKYVDVNGRKRRHIVSRHTNFWGSLIGDFLWDKPLKAPKPVEEIITPDSKEQIISDMDAEIKRLQEELRHAREEG